jgi:hypothetical protein
VLLALLVLGLVAVALLVPLMARGVSVARARRSSRARRRAERRELRDPGRERRAEHRARELLRSCLNEEEWAMYRDLGFIRVFGRLGAGGPVAMPFQRRRRDQRQPDEGDPGYAYVIYPHKPIVAYVPRTGRLLSEYCVEFPDLVQAIAPSRLPDSDDVLAKWMALTADERRVISDANMHLPGRQIDPERVRRDLWRLREWERLRRGPDAVRSPRP